MLVITSNLSIPERELQFRASRSSGPGGQHVNKVNTRMTLHFDIRNSPSLTVVQKSRVSQKLKTRINKDGIFSLYAHRSRSQAMNRADLLDKFCRLLREALTPQRPRRETRVPERSRVQRVDQKKRRGQLKQRRMRPTPADSEP